MTPSINDAADDDDDNERLNDDDDYDDDKDDDDDNYDDMGIWARWSPDSRGADGDRYRFNVFCKRLRL